MIGHGHILLADDNASDAELTMRALEKAAGCKDIVWVQDGETALNYVFRANGYENRRGGDPRFMLLDLHMPRVDGLEVLARIKADPQTRTIPVIIMSSSDQDRDMEESYALYANSYIVKPVDVTLFNEQVAGSAHYWMRVNRVKR